MRSFVGLIGRLSFSSLASFKRLNRGLKALGSLAPTYISYLPILANLADQLTAPRQIRNIPILKPSNLHPCPQLSPHLLIPFIPSKSSSLPILQSHVSRLSSPKWTLTTRPDFGSSWVCSTFVALTLCPLPTHFVKTWDCGAYINRHIEAGSEFQSGGNPGG